MSIEQMLKEIKEKANKQKISLNKKNSIKVFI